jgi:hypothetical protein
LRGSRLTLSVNNLFDQAAAGQRRHRIDPARFQPAISIRSGERS